MKWRPARFQLRCRQIVLHALAQVGDAGMTPNSLEVTTELAEPQLNATLAELMQAGLVTQRVADSQRVANGMLTDLHDKHYLLAEHAEPRH